MVARTTHPPSGRRVCGDDVRVWVHALPVCGMWLAVAVWLDLPHSTFVAGVVTAVVLAWRDEVRDRLARADEEPFERDDPFEQDEPFFYV